MSHDASTRERALGENKAFHMTTPSSALKAIKKYISTAEKLDKVEPVAAYYCSFFLLFV